MNTPDARHTAGSSLLRGVAASGFAVTVLAMFPGMMMWDSLDQLLQARDAWLNDWHPPLMTFIWMWLDRVSAGPFPMLALQCGLLWGGAYLILRAAPQVPVAVRAVVLLASVLFPPVFVVMGFITKDALMAGLLCFAFGLAATQHAQGSGASARRGWLAPTWWLFGACLVLAAGMRYNAGGAVWAVSAYAAHLHATRPWHVVRSLAIGLVAAVVCVGLSTVVNDALTDQATHPWKSLAAYDIASVARELNTMDFIDEADRADLAGEAPGGEWTLDRMQTAVVDWNHLEKAGVHVEAGPTLQRVWLDTIRRHPREYAASRLRMFRLNLRVSGDGPSQCLLLTPYTGVRQHTAEEVPGLFHFDYALTPVQAWLRDTLASLAYDTVLFWPGIYLALSVVALAWGSWLLACGNALPFFLALSGVAQQATLVMLAPAVNFRYSHWLIAATWFALLLLGADGVARALSRRRA